MRSALQITQGAINNILERGDGTEFVSPEDAQTLREAGVIVICSPSLMDGTYRVDFNFRGVPFSTVTDEPWK